MSPMSVLRAIKGKRGKPGPVEGRGVLHHYIHVMPASEIDRQQTHLVYETRQSL